MIIDLHHNKIISDTVTEKFEESVRERLIPILSEKYDGLLGIQMYEDYISDDLKIDGCWYYPLTVITEKELETQWISWRLDKSSFEGGVPYSYVGDELLEFAVVNEPRQLAAKLAGRSRFCESGLVKIRVEAAAPSPTFLSGKYSQTFVDEMARQLTPAISEAMSVEGLGDCCIELALVFAPETYMEHTSENVTYRRLLMTDGASAPRDFWIKWTRLDGATAYSVSDHVSGDAIVFEIGEDVSQKIREKEYRNLIRLGKDKYHNAMGRKNVTEWRDVIKRAIRRGELTRVEKIQVSESENKELEARLAQLLGADAPAVSDVTEAPVSENAADDGEFALAMQKLAMAAQEDYEADTEEYEAEEYEAEDYEADEDEEPDELDEFYSPEADLEVGEGVIPADDEEAEELDEITRMAMEALRLATARPAEVAFDDEPAEEDDKVETEEDFTDEETDESEADFEDGENDTSELSYDDPTADEYEYDEEDEDTLSDVRALEPDDEEADKPSGLSQAEIEAKIRAELEAKIRLEYESQARMRAEAEAERLRAEQEKLRLEHERLQARVEKERLEQAEREEARREEEAKLRAQIEMQLRAEQRERERLAEAARIAVEEQRRLEEERVRMEKARQQEAARLEEERRLAEEARRIEAERQAEAERIRREAEESAKSQSAAESATYENKNYTYVSKNVRLMFRKSVDPNVTARIYEIIKATIEYYGKEKVYLKIKATVPDSSTVCLEFVKIPMEEMELLSNIIKVLGNSGLGIAKAIVE